MAQKIGWFVIVTWFILLFSTTYLVIDRGFVIAGYQEQYYRAIYDMCLEQVSDTVQCNIGVHKLKQTKDLYNQVSPGWTWRN